MIGLHHGEPGRQIFREIRIEAAVEARGKGLILKKGMLMQQQGQANGRSAFLQGADGPGRHAVEGPAIAHDEFRHVFFPGEKKDGFL